MHDHNGRDLTVSIENLVDNMPGCDKEPVAADIEASADQTPLATRIVGQERKRVTHGIWKWAVWRSEVPRLWICFTAKIDQ
jgi:hypothetical protein